MLASDTNHCQPDIGKQQTTLQNLPPAKPVELPELVVRSREEWHPATCLVRIKR